MRSLGAAAAAAEAPTLCGIRFEAPAADPEPARGLRRMLALAREHPGFVTAWVVAGDRLRAAGRRLRARRAYEHGARVRPATVLLARLADLDAAEGHPERTVRTLRRLRRTHPHDPNVVAALAAATTCARMRSTPPKLCSQAGPTAVPVPALEALSAKCHRRREHAEQAVVHFVVPSDAARPACVSLPRLR